MASQPVIAEMTDEQFEQHALSIMSRELGVAGYARYLRLFGSGRGNFTADRYKWQEGLKVEDVLRELLTKKSL